MDLAARGAIPLAGGTRLLATSREVPNVLDLFALGLGGIGIEEGDLVLGATTTLQETIDSPLAYDATGNLLPAACRAQSASRAIRTMATLGGESVHGAHDSEVVAALLALNAVYVVAHPKEVRESPALRFLRDPAGDLDGGGLVQTIIIPGAPWGGGPGARGLAPVRALPGRGRGHHRVRRRAVHTRPHRRHRAHDPAGAGARSGGPDRAHHRRRRRHRSSPRAGRGPGPVPLRRRGHRRVSAQGGECSHRPRARNRHREGPGHGGGARSASKPPPRARTSASPPASLLHVGPDRADRERSLPAGRGGGADHPARGASPRRAHRDQGRLRRG